MRPHPVTRLNRVIGPCWRGGWRILKKLRCVVKRDLQRNLGRIEFDKVLVKDLDLQKVRIDAFPQKGDVVRNSIDFGHIRAI